jgi:type III secretion protein X
MPEFRHPKDKPMSDINIKSLVFDRGIDSITHARGEAASTMPERGNAPPPDVAVRAKLDILLQKPSIDSRMDLAVRPQIVSRDLLLPGPFRKALSDCLKDLRSAAESAADSSDLSRVLNRAVRLLSEESNLRDLLQMYRSALYQG